MMRVTIVRQSEGKSGALSWWVPTLMDESDRLRRRSRRDGRRLERRDAPDARLQALVYDKDPISPTS